MMSSLQAEVSVSIDRDPVRVNETFEFTLNMETAPVTRPPLTGLPKEFEIVRSSNFYQRSSINGQTEVLAGWRFILRATTEGIFTIPEFSVDNQKTQVLQITVLPAVNSTTIGGQQDAIRLTAEVDRDEVYVQQQVLLTVRLHRAVQAQYASLSEPIMEGAILERLGEDKQFETEIEGVRYIVLERHYVIFPQQVGQQTIGSVTFTAEVSDGSKRYSSLGRLRSRTKSISLSTEPIDISVKGRPAGNQNWWLPANNIELTEQWLPQPIEYQVGVPITWSYTIKANGLSATQLPELLPEESEGFKFYPDKPSSESKTGENGIIGMRTQKIAVVPTHEGEMTLPELKLDWWNTNTNKLESITLPARTVTILPSLTEVFVPNKATDLAPTKEIKISSASDSGEDSSTKPSDSMIHNKVFPWKMIAIFSLSLWIITALLLVIKNNAQASVSNKAKGPRKPGSTSLKEVKLADIKNACQQNDPIKTKDMILAWCKTNHTGEPILSLADLAKHMAPSLISEQLSNLEKVLYSNTSHEQDIPWNGESLKQTIHLLNDLNSMMVDDKNKTDTLPPLHPK